VIAELRTHFSDALDLPQVACDWLLDLWRVIQVFDDVRDGDPVDAPDLDTAVWKSLVSMPCNPFFRAHADALQSALASAVLKWGAANDVEEAGEPDERAYMWRAGYYDVVLLVVLLCHGPARARELASTVMLMYGEPYSDYRAEFPNA
jgi:hypothetical protein